MDLPEFQNIKPLESVANINRSSYFYQSPILENHLKRNIPRNPPIVFSLLASWQGSAKTLKNPE
jgi:hypothetical protein